MIEKFITQYWSYGVYDSESNNYRYLFTCRNDETAKRQFVAYSVGSNDLFNEPLQLHKLDRIGGAVGEIESDFLVLSTYKDIEKSVEKYREKTSKMINK